MDAIVLFGGKGTRMNSELPKALILVNAKPLIDYTLHYLLTQKNIDRIILALGYKSEEVVHYVSQKYQNKKIEFSIEKEPLGTAGAVKQALTKSASDFILVQNGDDLTNMNLKELEEKKASTICVGRQRSHFGKVTEQQGYAVFEEKPFLEYWVNAGWYVFERKELSKILPDKGSLEYDVFPKMKLRIHYHKGFWGTANSKKDIEELEKINLQEELTLKK